MLADGVITALGHFAQIIVVDAEAEPRCSGEMFVQGVYFHEHLHLFPFWKIARCTEIRRQQSTFFVTQRIKRNCHLDFWECGDFG